MKLGKLSTFKFVASMTTLMTCGVLAVGATYSLFTSEKDINTHLVISGNLKAELYLKELKQDVLDENGLIKNQTVDLATLKDKNGDYLVPVADKGVSLINYTGKIFDSVKLVPTMEGQATFLLENTGDVAFDYTIETTKVAYKADGTVDSTAAIMSQIEWNVVEPDNKQVTKGGSSLITVSYKFKDSEDNNDAQEQSMDLDILFKLSSVAK